jgi:hypothetical protein
MFSVMNRPCSAGEYNELPDVVDADAALKPLEAELDELIRHASQACLATPFEGGSLGGFLLHKHWELDDGYSMVERCGLDPSGRPALITSARPSDELTATAPSRFKVDPEGEHLVALEFSSDPLVVETWRHLNTQPDVLDRLCEIISASGLADKVGLGILTRRVPIDDDEFLVEENCDGESLLSARTLSAEAKEIVIQTGWAFIASEPPDGGTKCTPYCMQAGDDPHKRFHAKPKPPE